MHEVAEGVWHIPLAPRNSINAYLLGDVLVDAGLRGAGRLLGELQGHAVRAHALTHAHADHAGGSCEVAARLEVPVWVGEGDAPALESGTPATKEGWLVPGLLRRGGGFPPADVARCLREGDELGDGWVVLDTPGHSPGHVAFWRERGRVLVCGDVLFNFDLRTTRYGVREPPGPFTVDVARNRDSARRLAALDPAVTLFGHGPPLRDPAGLRAFADALPA